MSNKILEARRYSPRKYPADPFQLHHCQSERFRTGIVINFAQAAVGCRGIIRRRLWREQKQGDLDLSILTQSLQKKNDMGDRGQEAIHAAGRVIEPECRTSISQLFVSSCSTIPTRRVLSVAAVMDVAWTILQPAPCGEQPAEIDDVDAARAQQYALLAMLLARTPDAATLGRIAKLRGDATRLGRAHVALAQAADNASAERIQREFFNLFIGIERGELLPYASYYLTGLRNERPLVRVREDLWARGIERAEGQVEAEDHAAVLCEVMAGRPAARQRPRPGCSSNFFKGISPPGSGASSLIWNEPIRPTSIARWERSVGFSWRSRRRHSRDGLSWRESHRRTRR